MQTYNIVIDEQQRKIILAALHNCNPDFIDHCGDDATEQLLMLVPMFHDMPEVEAEHPEVIHGLCL